VLSKKQSRNWLAIWLQHRRRARKSAAVLPPMPIVTLSNGSYAPNGTAYDTSFDIDVNHLTWIAADLEIWWSLNFLPFEFLASDSSETTHFVHTAAFEGEGIATYKARYRNDGNVGEFSNELVIDVSI
jgi:hypothetical protein